MRRLLIVILFVTGILFLSALPRVHAQCPTFILSFGGEWTSTDVGLADAEGYTFEWLGGAGSPVSVEIYDTDGGNFITTLNAANPGPITIANPGYVYVAAASPGTNSTTVEYCAPVSPTETPTEVLVTPSFTPTPATPTVSSEVILQEMAQVQRNSFSWAVFAGVTSVGLLVLVFLRIRQ